MPGASGLTPLELAHRYEVVAAAYKAKAASHRRAASALALGKRDRLDLDEHFHEWIADAVVLAWASERLLELEVDLAREHKVTWEQIGAVLGVSRQAAFARFAPSQRRMTERFRRERRAARARLEQFFVSMQH